MGEELLKIKSFVSLKENENQTLRTSITSHNQTINELEAMLKGLKSNETLFKDKKKEIDNINIKIKDLKQSNLNNEKTTILENVTTAIMEDIKSRTPDINANDIKPSHHYSTSYITNNVEDEIQLKHIQELESIKEEYNNLV